MADLPSWKLANLFQGFREALVAECSLATSSRLEGDEDKVLMTAIASRVRQRHEVHKGYDSHNSEEISLLLAQKTV